MRAFVVCLSLLTVLALPAGAEAPTDRVYSLIGNWTCESALNRHGTMVFARESDRTISMRNRYTFNDGRSGEFDESYSVDPTGGHWSWSGGSPYQPTLHEDGSAPPWTTGDRWTIQGNAIVVDAQPASSIAPPQRHTYPMRVVYTQLADGVFRRDTEMSNSGRWMSTSVSTCKKGAS